MRAPCGRAPVTKTSYEDLCVHCRRRAEVIRKLTSWLRSEAPPDIVTLPNSLLIGLARPIREAVGRPICCTLQGEDLFLSQLQEPHRTRSLELIRANIEHVDGFAAISEYYAE